MKVYTIIETCNRPDALICVKAKSLNHATTKAYLYCTRELGYSPDVISAYSKEGLKQNTNFSEKDFKLVSIQ